MDDLWLLLVSEINDLSTHLLTAASSPTDSVLLEGNFEVEVDLTELI